ncbi:MAG: universal stress protein [Thermoleophilia bacterium]|nr:universal stress protein [Thermoleophilia bacterium]
MNATLQTVLVATSGSPSSQRAVDLGLAIASGSGAAAVFVHVLAPVVWVVRARGGPVRALPSRLLGAAWDEPLADAAERSDDAGVPYALELFAGDPADVIVRLADAADADLIVVGSRCGSRLARAGRVRTARRVVREAAVPVLVANGGAGAERRPKVPPSRHEGLGPGPVLS